MAHNLMIRDLNGIQKYSLIYREGMPTPWHNKQTQCDTFTHNDVYQAMEDVGANYKVTLSDATGMPGINPNGYKQVWGNGVLLGQAGERYTPVQNEYLFEKWHNVAVENGLKLATMGVLGHGERAFASYLVTDSQGRQLFINVANSHDGSHAVTLSINHVMVVCQNTLRLSESEGIIKTRHTKNAEVRIDGLSRFVDKQLKLFEDDGNKLERMKNIVADKQAYMSLIDKLTDAAKKEDEALKRDKLRQRLIDMYYNTTGVDNTLMDTEYGHYMAVTEALTHFRPTRSKEGPNVGIDRVFPPAAFAAKLAQVNNLMMV
jgi:hypothetical protein